MDSQVPIAIFNKLIKNFVSAADLKEDGIFSDDELKWFVKFLRKNLPEWRFLDLLSERNKAIKRLQVDGEGDKFSFPESTSDPAKRERKRKWTPNDPLVKKIRQAYLKGEKTNIQIAVDNDLSGGRRVPAILDAAFGSKVFGEMRAEQEAARARLRAEQEAARARLRAERDAAIVLRRAKRKAARARLGTEIDNSEKRTTKPRTTKKWTPENPAVQELLDAYVNGRVLKRVGDRLGIERPSDVLVSAYGKEFISSLRSIRRAMQWDFINDPLDYPSAMKSLLSSLESGDSISERTPPAVADDE